MKIEEELAIERITMVKRGCAKWIEGAYAIAIKALEKQIPKEPDLFPCDEWGKLRPICPICHSKVDGYLKDEYCRNCGQALKWGE